MIATTCWGGWVDLAGTHWWLCQDDEGFTCLYPEDEEGIPGIRLACDSEQELRELAAEVGIGASLLFTVAYRI